MNHNKSLKIALKDASENNDLKAIKQLHEQGADLFEQRLKLLLDAASHGSIGTIQYLLDKNISLLEDDEGCSLAHSAAIAACASGQVHIIQFLLKKGFDITQGDGNLLGIAARHGRTDMISYLINLGCDINGDNGFALRQAIYYKETESALRLMELGAKVDQNDNANLLAACNSRMIECIEPLIKAGARIKLTWNIPQEMRDYAIACQYRLEMKASIRKRSIEEKPSDYNLTAL